MSNTIVTDISRINLIQFKIKRRKKRNDISNLNEEAKTNETFLHFIYI